MKGLALGSIIALMSSAGANSQEIWRDPSPHLVQFVEVQAGVRLEVLDWGGSGVPLILLAGSGNTAHVFDDFAPKLTGFCHVYGITRRGFGASSQPATGYDEPRLAADIFAIIDHLGLRAPVVAGHSMAGGELTILGSEHSDRLSGLVYLDALFDVADYPANDPAFMAIVKKLPAETPSAPPTREEQTSFKAYRARQQRTEGFAFPESELHAGSETTPDGLKGKYKTPQWVFKAIGEGAKPRDYSRIRVPVLSINDAQKAAGDYAVEERLTDEAKAANDAYRTAMTGFLNRWKKNLLNGPPAVRFVDMPDAGHYLFMTREAQVIEELRQFVISIR